ncbi:DoxX family protein [Aureibaculum luteum]|uniref:DoxX family protein n=1 Tax=Aureibaculum luteum TaxID=1548456 RepID=UPI001300A394|nr:MauE/DoxX family redox-associated membrane protein [Aureibaculum luteum]
MIKVLRILLILFFLFAGSYHFINPDFYFDQIPPYFADYKQFINYAAGAVEMGLAIGVAIPKTRGLAVIGILLLLIAFIPTHWYVINQEGCIPTAYCIPLWGAWLRLLVMQPLLMFWAWSVR